VDCRHGAASGPTIDLTVALVGGVCLLYVAILPALRTLCLCAVFELWPAGRLLAFL
jgi:hypothetical protein